MVVEDLRGDWPGCRRRGRGQGALELAALAALAFMFLALVASVANGYRVQAISAQQEIGGGSICQQLAREVNVAVQMGDGYQRAVDLPYVYSMYDYVVAFDNATREVTVSWSDGSCQHPISANVSGSLVNGTNIIRVQSGLVMLN